MTPSRVQRLVLHLFPARFRARYEGELGALVPECDGGWRVTADLLRAAASEWLRPSFGGSAEERRRLRLQATTATVFVLWSFSTVAIAAFARAVDDQPVPGLRSWGWIAFGVGNVVFESAWAVVLVAGFAYWIRVALPAWRARDRRTLGAALVPAGTVVVWLAGTGLVALLAHLFVSGNHRHLAAQGPATAVAWTALAVYAVFSVACVAVCASSAVRALARSQLPASVLGRSTVLAALVTGALLVVTAAATVCLTRVLMVGHISTWDSVLAVAPVALLMLASAAATASTARGLRTLAAG